MCIRDRDSAGGLGNTASSLATISSQKLPEPPLWITSSPTFQRVTEAPTAAASRHELESDIQSAIDRLSPKMKTIVVLRYLQSLSYEEIAETLEISLGTVKSRLSRAHAALDRELTPVVDRHFIERNPAL